MQPGQPEEISASWTFQILFKATNTCACSSWHKFKLGIESTIKASEFAGEVLNSAPKFRGLNFDSRKNHRSLRNALSHDDGVFLDKQIYRSFKRRSDSRKWALGPRGLYSLFLWQIRRASEVEQVVKIPEPVFIPDVDFAPGENGIPKSTLFGNANLRKQSSHTLSVRHGDLIENVLLKRHEALLAMRLRL